MAEDKIISLFGEGSIKELHDVVTLLNNVKDSVSKVNDAVRKTSSSDSSSSNNKAKTELEKLVELTERYREKIKALQTQEGELWAKAANELAQQTKAVKTLMETDEQRAKREKANIQESIRLIEQRAKALEKVAKQQEGAAADRTLQSQKDADSATLGNLKGLGDTKGLSIDELKNNISTLDSAISNLNNRIQQQQQGINALNASYDSLNTQYVQQVATVKQLEQEYLTLANTNNVDNATLEQKKKEYTDAAKAAEDLGKRMDALSKQIGREQQMLNNSQKTLQSASNIRDKATAGLTKEADAQDKLLNAYEKMKAEYKVQADLAKRLGAEYHNLVKSGTATSDQLVEAKKRWMEASDASIEYHKALLQIEMSTGQSQRNVGNYNALVHETNQILREVPNFAMSARTGMMALSNNIPMFAEQFSRVSREIDASTGKMKGWRGALKEVGSAIFNWQTLILVAITLMVQYADEISEFFSNLSKGQLVLTNAEKAQKAYNEALKSGIDDIANSIGKLEALKTMIDGVNVTHGDYIKAIEDVKNQYPEFLDNIDAQNLKTKETNDLIEKQIALEIQRYKMKAQQEAITDAVKNKLDAESELYKKLTEGVKWYSKLWSGEAASISESIQKISDAQEQLNEASLTGIPRIQSEINSYNEIVARLEERLIKLTKQNNALNNATILYYRNAIEQTKEYIKLKEKKIDLIREASQYKEMSALTASVMEAETEMLNAIEGSTEQSLAKRKFAYAKYYNDIVELTNKYIELSPTGKIEGKALEDFTREYLLRTAQLNDELRPRVARTRKAMAKLFVPDIKDMEELYMRLRVSALNASMALNQDIFDNEERSLSERLIRYSDYISEKESLLVEDRDRELRENAKTLEKIAIIEKTAESKRTNEQKNLLLNKKYYQLQEQVIIQEHLNKVVGMQNESEKKRRQIVESSINYALNTTKKRLDEVSNTEKEGFNEQLAALNDRYKQGNMTYRAYMRERQIIASKMNKALYEVVLGDINAQMEEFNNQLEKATDPDQIKMLQTLLNFLKNAKAEMTPPQDERRAKSWIEVIFGGNPDDEDTAEYLDRYKKAIFDQVTELYQNMFNLIDELREAHYQKQFEMLDEEGRKIKENAKIEADAINSSLMNEKEKRDKIEELNAKTEAQEKAIDVRRRQMQRRQAEAEKRDAMFKLALDSAMAVGKAFANFSFPQNLILAAIAAANMATQMAIVSARPIPQYGEGTDYHKGGYAVVGDKGVEQVNLPSGVSFLTPDKPVLMDLPKGAQVIPNKDLLDATHANLLRNESVMAGMAITPDSYAKALISTFESKIDELQTVILNKKETHFYWDNGQLRKAVKNGNNVTKYLNNIF